MKSKNFIENRERVMVEDLIEFIKIKSVVSEPEPFKPFGSGIDDALTWALNKCEGLGMKTFKDPEGYYGYADIGEGSELLGILMHVDVVPSGDAASWTFEPFNPAVSGGKLYGRGAIDDKGPIVSILYAIEALLEMGTVFRKKIRLIFGTDEETHWRGIKKYLSAEQVPNFSFTPDASFPLIFAEKGLLQLHIKSKSAWREPEVEGGSALNAVPESAAYRGSYADKLEKVLKRLGFDYEKNGEEVIVIGKSAHSASPGTGINAITRLAHALHEVGVKSKAVAFINERIGFANNGSLLFGTCYDQVSGYMSMSLNQIALGGKNVSMGLDIRIPVTMSCRYVFEAVSRVSEKYGFECEVIEWLEPIYTSTNHPHIDEMLRVYTEETGLDNTPVATGGATYARALPHCVAFGPNFPGQPKTAHRTDESIDIKSLVKMTQIYAKTIEALL